MTEKQDIPSERTEPGNALKNGASPARMADDKTEDVRTETKKSSVPKSKIGRMSDAIKAFLKREDGDVPEPPRETPLMETVRDFVGRCRDREKRAGMLKEIRACGPTMLFHGAVYLILFALTVWAAAWALNYNEKHRIDFFPPDEVTDYLSSEHEALEAVALKLTPSSGRNDSIPSESFDAKCIEIVKPLMIYGDEYGIYLVTGKDRYNGEHGIFFAKDTDNMPPDLNWGLIEGRIYTYAIYD